MTLPHVSVKASLTSFSLTHFERVLLRILFAFYLYLEYPFRVPFREQPYPHGLAQYFDLTFFSDPNVQAFFQVGMLVALVFYCMGRLMIVSLVFLLVATIGPVTLLYSQGYVNHGFHIFPLILLGQLLAYSYSTISRFIGLGSSDKARVDNMSFFFSRQMVASIYVAAGISKLVATHGTWPLQALNLAPSVIRTHAEEYYAKLEPGVLEAGEWISRLIMEHPMFFVVLFGAALLTELTAFLAVSSRRLAFVVGIGLILMHEGIALTMSINFRRNEFIIFVFFILPFLTQQIARWKLFGRPESKSVALVPKKTPRIISILDRIPLKLTLCIVALGLIVHELYPFSSFAMYSTLPPQTHYYYVTDENKKPISTLREFKLPDSAPAKMITTRMRRQAKTLAMVDESEIGKQFLRYLIDIRVPKAPPKYQQLLLWKVIVSLKDRSLVKQEYLVASISVPQSL